MILSTTIKASFDMKTAVLALGTCSGSFFFQGLEKAWERDPGLTIDQAFSKAAAESDARETSEGGQYDMRVAHPVHVDGVISYTSCSGAEWEISGEITIATADVWCGSPRSISRRLAALRAAGIEFPPATIFCEEGGGKSVLPGPVFDRWCNLEDYLTHTESALTRALFEKATHTCKSRRRKRVEVPGAEAYEELGGE